MKKRILMILIIIGVVLIGTTTIVVADGPPLGSDPNLVKIGNFIKFIVAIIRWGASSVAGLIVAATGWEVLHSKTANGMDTAKKSFKNALWGLFFIFGGTSISAFVVNKFVDIFISGGTGGI